MIIEQLTMNTETTNTNVSLEESTINLIRHHHQGYLQSSEKKMEEHLKYRNLHLDKLYYSINRNHQIFDEFPEYKSTKEDNKINTPFRMPANLPEYEGKADIFVRKVNTACDIDGNILLKDRFRCLLFKLPDMSPESVYVNENKLNSWDALMNGFIDKFKDPHQTAFARKELLAFKFKPQESPHLARIRFMSLLLEAGRPTEVSKLDPLDISIYIKGIPENMIEIMSKSQDLNSTSIDWNVLHNNATLAYNSIKQQIDNEPEMEQQATALYSERGNRKRSNPKVRFNARDHAHPSAMKNDGTEVCGRYLSGKCNNPKCKFSHKQEDFAKALERLSKPQ